MPDSRCNRQTYRSGHMSAGYYIMQRGWLDHPAFGSRKREPFCRAAAWVWLIEHAAYAMTQVSIGGAIVTLKRGQLTHSLRHLGEVWGWQHDRVRRFLRELETREMVEFDSSATASATAQTVITICKYSDYQDGSLARATAPNGSATAMRQQRDSECDSSATASATAQTVITSCNDSGNRGDPLARATAPNGDARQQKNGGCAESATIENQGNQEVSKSLKILKREMLGRDAPSGGPAPPDPEPPAPAATGTEIPAETPVADAAAAEAIPEEERAYIEAGFADLVQAVAGGARHGRTPRPPGIYDPVAYQRAVTVSKRENWLNRIHAFASQNFDGQARWDAWEAIDIARRAGSREATPPHITKLIDSMDEVCSAAERVAA